MLEDSTHEFLCGKCGGQTLASYKLMTTVPHLKCKSCGHDLTDQMAAKLASITAEEAFLEEDHRAINRG